MKRLILRLFLMAGVISATLLCSSQKKMTPDQKNSTTDQILDNQRIYSDYDNNTNTIICEEDDKEVCEYIEQQKKFNLKIWLQEQGFSLFLKLMYLREYLDKYKETFVVWLKKLIVMPY